MKKILALVLAMMMLLALAACGGGSSAAEPAAPAEPAEAPEAPEAPEAAGTYTVTFSTGETYELAAGEDLVFFFQCDAPGDMGAPEAGEEGAGITVSEGTVSYSNVGVGGPFSYPTSELVTVTGITGDITVTVTDAATANNATHTIYFGEEDIAAAIAFAEEMAAQMAANPMGSGEPSGEPSDEPADDASDEPSGEPSGALASSGDYDIEVDGVSGTAHYEDTDNGDQATKSFVITFDGKDIPGAIDKGVWTADDPADQAVVDAVKVAFEGGNVIGPAA